MTTLAIAVAVSEDRPRGKILGRGTQENFRHLRSFHRLCRKYTIVPTYMLSYPAIESKHLAWLFESFERQECELGTLFQSWTTPPFEATENRLASTPTHRQRRGSVERKFAALHDAFERRIGRKPRSNMSEGWDYSTNLLQALMHQGYEFDCSLAPMVSSVSLNRHNVPRTPFFPSVQAPTQRGTAQLLEMPILTSSKVVHQIGWAVPSNRGLRRLLDHTCDRVGITRTVVDPLRQNIEVIRLAVEHAAGMGQAPIIIPINSFDIGVATSNLASSAAELSDLLQDLDRLFCELVDTLRIRTMGVEACGTLHLNGAPSH
jgi:hypothetical protein